MLELKRQVVELESKCKELENEKASKKSVSAQEGTSRIATGGRESTNDDFTEERTILEIMRSQEESNKYDLL